MENDAKRARLYTTLTDRLGAEAAETIMDTLPPFDWPQIATKSDVSNLRVEFDARFDKVDARFDRLEAKFDAKFEGIEARFEARFEGIDAKFDRMEAKIDAQFTRLLTTLLPVMALMFGVVLAVTRIT